LIKFESKWLLIWLFHQLRKSTTMNIAILDDYQDAVRTLDCFRKLAGQQVKVWNDHCKQVDVLADRLRDVEALVLIRERTPITEALLSRLPKLKLISQFGHAPHIDLEACTRHDVMVCSRTAPGRPSYGTAELTWGLIIAASRRIPQEMQSLKNGEWQSKNSIGRVLRGRTLGVFGYGRIGTLVAGYGRAFGMNVLVWASPASKSRASAEGYDVAENVESFFSSSDILSLHLALRDSTRGIVTPALLASMKSTSLLVNTSRAELLEAGALEAALKAGHPGSAAIDVFEQEPIVDGWHPLLKLDNLIATPHIGFVEREGFEIMFGTMIDQVLSFEVGAPVNVLNPDILQH
jgi:D-3-phosphoglycerate dehydrogenase